jgi:hypothetical protein
MTQINEETDRILEKYGDLMSEEEKNELLGNDQMPCAPPVISGSDCETQRKFNCARCDPFCVYFLLGVHRTLFSENPTSSPCIDQRKLFLFFYRAWFSSRNF